MIQIVALEFSVDQWTQFHLLGYSEVQYVKLASPNKDILHSYLVFHHLKLVTNDDLNESILIRTFLRLVLHKKIRRPRGNIRVNGSSNFLNLRKVYAIKNSFSLEITFFGRPLNSVLLSLSSIWYMVYYLVKASIFLFQWLLNLFGILPFPIFFNYPLLLFICYITICINYLKI